MVQMNFNSFIKNFIKAYNNSEYFLLYKGENIMDSINPESSLYIMSNDTPTGLNIKLFDNSAGLIYALINAHADKEWYLTHIVLDGFFNTVSLKSTEEEIFQRSLIDSEICDYEDLKFIRRLLKEVMDKVNQAKGLNYVI